MIGLVRGLYFGKMNLLKNALQKLEEYLKKFNHFVAGVLVAEFSVIWMHTTSNNIWLLFSDYLHTNQKAQREKDAVCISW